MGHSLEDVLRARANGDWKQAPYHSVVAAEHARYKKVWEDVLDLMKSGISRAYGRIQEAEDSGELSYSQFQIMQAAVNKYWIHEASHHLTDLMLEHGKTSKEFKSQLQTYANMMPEDVWFAVTNVFLY